MKNIYQSSSDILQSEVKKISKRPYLSEKELYDYKQQEIKKFIFFLDVSNELLLADHIKEKSIFNLIKKLAISKGGFLNNQNRVKLWKHLLYLKKSTKGFVRIIKIDKKMKVNMNIINWNEEKEKFNQEKLKNSDEYNSLIRDLPRTCNNIVERDENKNINEKKSINNKNFKEIPEVVFFTSDSLKYNYLQGLLNLFYYFKKLFKKNILYAISSVNIYLEIFNKEFVDYDLNKNENEKIIYISSIISDLYKKIYKANEIINQPENENESSIEDYISTLVNKWIISSFVQEMKNMETGYRIFDYLLVSEPYIKYILATVLVKKYEDKIMEKMKYSSNLMFDETFNELKKEDLNFIDFEQAIEEVEKINDNKGNEIKKFLVKKYGNQFIFTFNYKNQGLTSYYENFDLDKKKKDKLIKINSTIPDRFLIDLSIAIIVLMGTYYFIRPYV